MYKISVWTQTGTVIKTIIQIFLAYNLHNLYIWVSIEFIFGLIICWILNYVISKEYPWLKTDKNNGRTILKKYPEIITKAKQIVIHRLKNFFLSKSDELFIFAFESLRIVTYYGNYIMIVGKLTELVNNVLMGMNASIANIMPIAITFLIYLLRASISLLILSIFSSVSSYFEIMNIARTSNIAGMTHTSQRMPSWAVGDCSSRSFMK